jgi:phage/conjugal plasmid C-4 type zinc finger TraR family protein
MADEVDLAYEEEQRTLSALLAKRTQYHGESAELCEDCGDEIPLARRRGVPGVRTCVSCQELREREAKLQGHN